MNTEERGVFFSQRVRIDNMLDYLYISSEADYTIGTTAARKGISPYEYDYEIKQIPPDEEGNTHIIEAWTR